MTVKKYIRTIYHKDGTISRLVVGMKGEACLAAAAPYNQHLPAGYVVTPTEEMAEIATVSQEARETQ